MTIDLDRISKRYTDEWILRNVSYHFESGKIYGIQGANGSGKSTLIKMISGYLSPSMGEILYKDGLGIPVSRDDVYRHCSIWGPHVSLIPQLTIDEMIAYYFTYKSMRQGISKSIFQTTTDLPVKGNRMINSLSSGQEQRLGLALSILSDSDMLLLDEPGSFLDKKSQTWLYNLIKDHAMDRLVIISSNEAADLEMTKERLTIEDFK